MRTLILAAVAAATLAPAAHAVTTVMNFDSIDLLNQHRAVTSVSEGGYTLTAPVDTLTKQTLADGGTVTGITSSVILSPVGSATLKNDAGKTFALDSLRLFNVRVSSSDVFRRLTVQGFLNGAQTFTSTFGADDSKDFETFSPITGVNVFDSIQFSVGTSFGAVVLDNITLSEAVLPPPPPVGPPTSAVPEPATWAMMILGFGLVGATARRRCTVSVAA